MGGAKDGAGELRGDLTLIPAEVISGKRIVTIEHSLISEKVSVVGEFMVEAAIL